MPDIRLTNQFGQPMSLRQFRGKVMLIGFVDSECTTVCPLTTLAMLEAKQMLGAAGDHVQLLGIDANPDAITTSDVLGYSRAHSMVNRWDFLTGSLPQLKAAWKAFDIYARIDSGQVDHTPALYVVDAQGREQVVYLTAMAYSSISQSAQVVAQEVAGLLPGHPVLAHSQSLAYITGQTPAQTAAPARGAPGRRAGDPRAGPAAPRGVLRDLAVGDHQPGRRADQPELLRPGRHGPGTCPRSRRSTRRSPSPPPPRRAATFRA